jgi:hypothetical protein
MKIAVDRCAMPKAGKLRALHNVVVIASDKEPDVSWLVRAIKLGAQAVATNDKQVLFLAKCLGLSTIDPSVLLDMPSKPFETRQETLRLAEIRARRKAAVLVDKWEAKKKVAE